MQSISLEAENRTVVSTGDLKKMRKEGWIPAVLYGKEGKNSPSENILLKVPVKSLSKAIGSHNALIELKFSNQSANAVIKEIQRDIVSRELLHVDFFRISMTEKVEVMIPLHLIGEAPGVKLSGGILQHPLRELKVICLPKDIPADIKIDISSLEIGQSILVKDLKDIPGVQILTDTHQLLANVVAPTVLEETPAEAAAAAAEPEVIAKGKKPEEGEEAAPASPTGKPAKGQEKGAPAPAKGGAAAAPAAGKPAK